MKQWANRAQLQSTKYPSRAVTFAPLRFTLTGCQPFPGGGVYEMTYRVRSHVNMSFINWPILLPSA